jgi:hypothetical protein
MREWVPPNGRAPQHTWARPAIADEMGTLVCGAAALTQGGTMKSLTFVRTVFRIAILALLLPASIMAAQKPDSTTISKLLGEVRSHAAQADIDAHTLATYTKSRLDWRTHSTQLTAIKDHVNDLIRDGNQLSTIRDEGSPWQQEAIDRISSLLPEMASHLTATITHLRQNQGRTHMKPYRDLALANQTIIHNAHEIISDYVEYGEAKAKADALEKDLQLSTVSEKTS